MTAGGGVITPSASGHRPGKQIFETKERQSRLQHTQARWRSDQTWVSRFAITLSPCDPRYPALLEFATLHNAFGKQPVQARPQHSGRNLAAVVAANGPSPIIVESTCTRQPDKAFLQTYQAPASAHKAHADPRHTFTRIQLKIRTNLEVRLPRPVHIVATRQIGG